MATSDPQEEKTKKKYRDLGEFGSAVRDAITLPRVVRWIRGIIAVTIWGTLLVDLFAVDLVSPVTTVFPTVEAIVRFRFLILLILAAVVLLSFRNRYLLLFVGYIAFFPLVLVVWILPRTIFRNWVVVLAFWPAIHSFVSTFRISFCLWVAAVVSCFGIALFADRLPIATCMGVLGAYFLTHYGRRVYTAFSSKTGFAALTPIVRVLWQTTVEAERSPINADPDSEDCKRKFGQRLMNLYLTTTMLYLVGEKLRVVIRTKKLDLYLVCSFVYTFLMTIAVFGFQYLGLHRIASVHFSVAAGAGLLNFIGYSLSTALNAGISPIVPLTLSSQMLSYAELIFMLLLAVLFVFVLFTSARERHQQDLDDVVNEIGEVSGRMGTFLLQNYDLTIAAADQYLLQVNPLIARWALRALYGEDRAKEIPGFIDKPEEGAATNEALPLERAAAEQDARKF